MNIFAPIARFLSPRAPAAPGAGCGCAEKAVDTFRGGINCTQAVLAACGTAHGIEREDAMRLGGAFGSGMNMGETCGAVTGALMVLGLRHAKVTGAGFLTRDRTAAATLAFVERFKERNGSVSCKELLGCDLGTPEGRAAARRDGSFKKRCPKFVRDAAEILDEMERARPGETR